MLYLIYNMMKVECRKRYIGVQNSRSIYKLYRISDIFFKFQNNKKVEAQPRPFYCSEISKLSEILYNFLLKVTNLFTLGGQDLFLNSLAVLVQL